MFRSGRVNHIWVTPQRLLETSPVGRAAGLVTAQWMMGNSASFSAP